MITITNTADTDRTRRQALERHRRDTHPGCVVCDPTNPFGLNLRCEPDGDGRVAARFNPEPWMAGYDGRVHGGVVSALLDGAMTQCLFAHDVVAVTAVMHIRFRRPAPLDRELDICAWIDRQDKRRHRVKAELRDDSRVIAEAEALFMPMSDEP